MATIDERVVSIAFENTVFEQRVATTMSTLSKLDASIKNIGTSSGLQNIEAQANKVTLQGPMSALDKLKAKLGLAGSGAAQGFSEIDKAGNKVTLEGPSRAVDKLQGKMGQLSAGSTFSDIEKASNQVQLSGMSQAIDGVAGKFNFLLNTASVALGGIAAQAAMKGAAFAKSFAFGPLTQGLQEYQTNLQSIQTILANTEGQQVSGLGATNKALGELNEYSDRTIYNFGEMAKNIGTFTAAGVDLPKSVESIKGIANLAALSGSSSQQAATAMYQLSQAIAAGRVGLQDWNSVVNAGMGGAKFQQALMRTAENMGALEKGAVKIDKATGKATVNGQSFRESIMAKPGEQSWLTSDVLTKTLGQFTGDMTDAQLAAQGFSKEQIKAIQSTAKTAQEAATQVKTLPQVFDVARESIGSGWAKTFQLIFGDFEQAKETFTGLSNFINGFIKKVSDARNKVLGEWSELGGRDALIDNIIIAWDNLERILKAVYEAFRQVFPPTTGEQLYDLTVMFGELMLKLTPSPQLLDNIRRIFAGLFAALHIGWTVIKEVVRVFFDLFGVIGKGSGGFLGFVASIGDFVVAIDKAITKGGALRGIFDALGAILKVPLELLKAVGSAIAGLFGGTDSGKANELGGAVENLGEKVKPLAGIVNGAKAAWEKFKDILGKIKEVVEPAFTKTIDFIADFGNKVTEAFESINWDTALQALQTGLIGGIFLKLRSALSGGLGVDVGGGMLEKIGDSFEALTGHLQTMQQNVQAGTLLKIAAAVGILAGAIFVISTIPPKKVSDAMAAIAIGMLQLIGGLALLSKVGGPMAFATLPLMATGLLILATAMVVLSGAMKIFATMSWEDIAQGLVGVGGSLVVVAGAVNLMNPVQLMAAGVAMIPLATGIAILATAVKIFATMSWEELAKGLLGFAGALGAILLTMFLMPPGIILTTSAGILGLAIAMTMIGSSIAVFGNMDLKTLVQGLVGFAAALMIIGGAMILLPPGMVIAQAAGLLIFAGAMTVIAGAIAILGNLDILNLVKGIGALAAILVVLSVGLYAMTGTLPGAVALLAAAGALAILGPAIGFMGQLEWGTILKGLAAMVLSIGALAAVGAIAAVPLIALGAAIAVLGAGLLVIGAAVYLAAKGISLIGADGVKAMAALTAAIGAFIVAFPKMVIDFVKGLVTIVAEVAKLAPSIVTSLVSIVSTLVDGIITLAPKAAEAIHALITAILQVLNENAGPLLAGGLKLINTILSGFASGMPKIIDSATRVITGFLEALARNAPKIVASGVTTLIKFISGIISQLPRLISAGASLVNNFLQGITLHIPKVVPKAVTLITTFINTLAKNVGKFVAAGSNLILKFLDGIGNAIPKIVAKGLEIARKFLNALADGLVGLADAGFKALIKFLNGLERSIRENTDDLIEAGAGIADAILDGIVKAFEKGGWLVKKAAEVMFGLLPGWVKKILGIRSPSSVFAEIGMQTVEGMAKGIGDSKKSIVDSSKDMADGVINTVKGTLGIRSPSEVMREIGKEVGTGFKQGIHGSAPDIRSAFASLNDRLKESMKTARQTIKEEQAKIDEELKKKQPDLEVLRESQKVIDQNNKVLTATANAHRVLMVGLTDEKNRLIGLTKEYDKVTKQLEEAEKVLEDATRARVDAQRQYTEQYFDLPEIGDLVSKALADLELTEQERQERITKIQQEAEKKRQIDQVALYKKALEEQIKATQKYNETLQKLRAAGLDDATYKRLLAQGIAGQDFADALLRSGKQGIDEINKLDAELLAEAGKLAQQAADNLYKAGVDAAQGLVDGLKAKQKDLADVMDNLADMMVRSIKRQLKIRSPSQIFGEIGKLTIAGLAQGFTDNVKMVEDATASVGDRVVSAMQSSLSGISDSIEVDPVITPVLDLTQVEKGAKGLADLTNVTPITAAASFSQAAAISDMQKIMAETGQVAQAGPTFSYTQNNYSPEALSDVEIYRQTKNQLAQVKSALGLVS
jgi:tape measure domain-containing protein